MNVAQIPAPRRSAESITMAPRYEPRRPRTRLRWLLAGVGLAALYMAAGTTVLLVMTDVQTAMTLITSPFGGRLLGTVGCVAMIGHIWWQARIAHRLEHPQPGMWWYHVIAWVLPVAQFIAPVILTHRLIHRSGDHVPVRVLFTWWLSGLLTSSSLFAFVHDAATTADGMRLASVIVACLAAGIMFSCAALIVDGVEEGVIPRRRVR